MRWTCGVLVITLVAGFAPAVAEMLPSDAPYSQRLVDWTEQGREIYNTVKKLQKGTHKEIYEKYSNQTFSMYLNLLHSKKDLPGTYDCKENLSYLGRWIQLFYDFRADSSKKHNMSPEGVKEFQDWLEKGYLENYQECQRIFKIHKLSPSQ